MQRRHAKPLGVLLAAGSLALGSASWGQELTPNVDINQFQIPGDFKPSYDFNAPPRGLFREIHTAEGFEEELGFRRAHEYVPVSPTEVFRPNASVFVVFQTHQHYESFQVIGLCYPEDVKGLDPKAVLVQDAVYMALEDESGYLKIPSPADGWKPGKYKVEIHIGYQVNDISLIGTMHFTVDATLPPSPQTGTLPPG